MYFSQTFPLFRNSVIRDKVWMIFCYVFWSIIIKSFDKTNPFFIFPTPSPNNHNRSIDDTLLFFHSKRFHKSFEDNGLVYSSKDTSTFWITKYCNSLRNNLCSCFKYRTGTKKYSSGLPEMRSPPTVMAINNRLIESYFWYNNNFSFIIVY